jgi:hypothetical protein
MSYDHRHAFGGAGGPCPVLASGNLRYGCAGHAEIGCNDTVQITASETAFYRLDINFGEDRTSGELTTTRSTANSHIFGIVRLRTGLKMRRIATYRIIAPVADHSACRQRFRGNAVGDTIRHAMRVDIPAAGRAPRPREQSIGLAATPSSKRALPWPAFLFAALVNALPETFGIISSGLGAGPHTITVTFSAARVIAV